MWADTYEQLTSIEDIDESAEYVLGIDGTGFHYSGTSSWGKTALPSAQTPFKYTLKVADDGKSFTAKTTISSTTYYLQVPLSNTFGMATSTGTNTDLIIGTTQVSGTNYAIANKSTTARHLRINGSSGLRSYASTTGSMAFFYKVVETPTITAQSNNDSYGTVSLNGSVITATPASGYTYASPAYTVSPDNSATVVQEGNKFTVTPSANTTVTINFEAIPTYTVTFGDEGSVTQETAGAEVTLPSRSETAGYAFVGWSETNVTEETTTAPSIIPVGGYTPTANITLYPVYSKTQGGGGSQNKSANITISNYASTNSWVNGTKYTSITLDANATASVSKGGGNTGKYYETNSSWRFYANESAKLTISIPNGELTSITITYTGNTLTYGGNNVTSATAVSVSGTSAEFAVSGSSSNSQITAISVNYTITGAGTTYYWSAPVAAAVEMPSIVVAENPFLFSTTATISCDTENATIYYRYSENDEWTAYTGQLTITADATIYAKAVKDETESTVASVEITKNLAEPTITIDDTGITNTNVYDGTEAGSLAASVTYNDVAVEGAAVTWSGNNDGVATINASTGAVTLVGDGTVTFTATYAGNGDYAEKTKTYEMTVTNSDPNAPGTENNPYTIAEIIDFIETLNGGTSSEVFVKGIISQIDSYNSKYGSITYWISADGTTATQFECYSGLGLNGDAFSSIDDLQLGDDVVVAGTAKKYGDVYEFNYNNYIVSLVRVEKPVAPTFSVAGGTYTQAQSVELSTTTENAAIYYTLDGTDPTAESTEYTSAIEITETTTIKAIAVKDDVASDVATATYTINKAPYITVALTEVNVEAAGAEGSIEVTYNNMTADEYIAEVVYCDAEGNNASYDWLVAVINDETNNIDYLVSENTSTEARTAYIKVYALYDDDYFSDIITITQAGIDYATLPFAWEGSSDNGKSSLEAMTGVTTSGLGSDYAASNAPYRIKLDGTGDYIQVKTDCKPVMVTMDVKMIGGKDTSKITVQESADGKDFTDVEELTINGAQNTVLYLQTANDFKDDTRYVRLNFTRGSNVGVGGIAIEKDLDAVTIGNAGYTTYVTKHNVSFPAEVEAYIATTVNGAQEYVTLTQVNSAPRGTALVLKNEGTFTLSPTASPEDVSDNILLASDGTIEGDGSTIFALGNKSGVGFYLVANGQTVPAGKAYLSVPAAVKGFLAFDFGNTDAIKTVQGAGLKDAAIFNLAGQRMSRMHRGVNLVNGKKIILK